MWLNNVDAKSGKTERNDRNLRQSFSLKYKAGFTPFIHKTEVVHTQHLAAYFPIEKYILKDSLLRLLLFFI